MNRIGRRFFKGAFMWKMNSLIVVSWKNWILNGRIPRCKREKKTKWWLTHVFIILHIFTVLGIGRPLPKLKMEKRKKKKLWCLCHVLTAQWSQHRWDLEKAFCFSVFVPGWQNKLGVEGHMKYCFSTHLMSRFSLSSRGGGVSQGPLT